MTKTYAELLAENEALRAQVEALTKDAAYLQRTYDAFGRAHFPDEGQQEMLINATRFWDLLGGEYGSENWPDEMLLVPADDEALTRPAVPWRDAVHDLIDECPGLTMEQDRWLSRRVKELGFPSMPVLHRRPAVPEGWRLVPVEPTAQMIDAALNDEVLRLLNDEVEQLRIQVKALTSENSRLNAIINTPQRDDLLRAVSTEAEHQR